MLTFESASSLGIHNRNTFIWDDAGKPADICDCIAQSKWSSSLWTVMSYLFSWRGYWEMIWRWRLLVQSKPFFCSSWGREKMAVWHQGRQGRTSNVFTQAPRHLWSRRGTVLLHWAHVQKSESHYMYLVYVCVCLCVREYAEQQQGDGKM